MNFSQAMSEECRACGEKASSHRLTKSGVLYCLTSKVGSYPGVKTMKVWASTTKVNNLVKSPLPSSVGETINEGFGSYL